MPENVSQPEELPSPNRRPNDDTTEVMSRRATIREKRRENEPLDSYSFSPTASPGTLSPSVFSDMESDSEPIISAPAQGFETPSPEQFSDMDLDSASRSSSPIVFIQNENIANPSPEDFSEPEVSVEPAKTVRRKRKYSQVASAPENKGKKMKKEYSNCVQEIKDKVVISEPLPPKLVKMSRPPPERVWKNKPVSSAGQVLRSTVPEENTSGVVDTTSLPDFENHPMRSLMDPRILQAAEMRRKNTEQETNLKRKAEKPLERTGGTGITEKNILVKHNTDGNIPNYFDPNQPSTSTAHQLEELGNLEVFKRIEDIMHTFGNVPRPTTPITPENIAKPVVESIVDSAIEGINLSDIYQDCYFQNEEPEGLQVTPKTEPRHPKGPRVKGEPERETNPYEEKPKDMRPPQ